MATWLVALLHLSHPAVKPRAVMILGSSFVICRMTIATKSLLDGLEENKLNGSSQTAQGEENLHLFWAQVCCFLSALLYLVREALMFYFLYQFTSM